MRCTRTLLALSLAASTMLASPALAVDPADQIGGSGPLQINPTLGYIMFRLQQKSEMRLLRIPADAERRKYDATRSFELVRAQSKNPTLNEADFEMPPLELYNFINTQMGPVFDKIDGQNVYLIAVRPGTYMLYGHMWLSGPGDAETCFCLGSVAFEARAGHVVDIGRVRLNDDWDGPPLPPNPAGNRPFALIPTGAAAPVSPRLQGVTVVPARFHATGKIPNYFGALIDRLSAIPGVLAYDRDTVIDAASGEPIH
jgi:hypothetical protein